MFKKIWCFILTVGLLLTLTPDTVMAANAGKNPALVHETADQETQTKQPAAVKTDIAKPIGTHSSLEGSGTETNPYRIKDAGQLRVFADLVNGVSGTPNTGICAVLTQNIDLSGVCGADIGSWTPIGTNTNPYKGTFDGGSFAVSGLYCQKPGASYAGLFASNAGTIKNLGVAGGSVSAGNYAGGLCGINKGTITGCYSAASVTGDRYTGGICGYNNDGATVSVCYNTGTINGSKYVGGICGYNKNTTSNCYNTGTVIGSGTSIGGICGYNKKLVSGCYNTGEVGGGTSYVGSICGYNHSGSTFVNCYYLITGTEKGNYGVAMTAQQFASGEVCWALNEGNGGSVVWRQTCGAGLPGFGGKTVYRTQTYKSDGSAVYAYTNDGNKKAAAYTAPTVPYTAPAATGSSGETASESSGEHTHVYQEPTWKWKKYESAKAILTCQDCGEEFVLKASIKKEVTEATCTEDGETVYTASVERDGNTYKDKRIVEKKQTGHLEFVELTAGTAATCEKPGYKITCLTCPACRKYFDKVTKKELSKTKVESEKPLKHDYPAAPTWQPWKTDTTTPVITATFTCQRAGCTKTVPVAAKVKYTDTVAPTCETPGTRIYTATVTFDGQTYPYDTPATIEIPAKGHSLKLDPNSADAPQYKCTRCGKTVPLNDVPNKTADIDIPKDGNAVAEDAPTDSNNTESEELNAGDAIPEGTESTLPSDSEEKSEAPTPPEEGQDGSEHADEPDTPNIPDASDGADEPDVPDGSGGTVVPDTPNVPGGSNGADVPDTPNAPGGSSGADVSDTPNISDGSGNADDLDLPDEPDEPGTTDELNEPETIDNTMESTLSYGLLDSEGEVADVIEGRTVALHTASAENDAVQSAGEQQGIPLWGLAIVLTLLTGIVLLIVLREKHN
ncbi:MAG: hypothetical protein K2K90_09085 [Lachnospiraceae bacterium]|nr:hypothetical protein [Lachnospiraceae bacterium]